MQVWTQHPRMLCACRKHRVLAASNNALADDPVCDKVWHRRAANRYVQKLDIGTCS